MANWAIVRRGTCSKKGASFSPVPEAACAATGWTKIAAASRGNRNQRVKMTHHLLQHNRFSYGHFQQAASLGYHGGALLYANPVKGKNAEKRNR
ncbi:hypothetical protein HM1_2467 [Heliomicrobium modesticaldum Ice1]|uniref:Uncharacterized protein n=1 Tax=Heliobacterium modesticaldum (strain ATCC 51547 / Ice1) TaxID=498761 RepID=B0TAG7_HELMI|nr:hypothetical protein [Heliomicrobium modesticaldum]ABZ85017.1 hypothetical protein HM1_2467 [Heliomicrobium modesticaldum Ice1]